MIGVRYIRNAKRLLDAMVKRAMGVLTTRAAKSETLDVCRRSGPGSCLPRREVASWPRALAALQLRRHPHQH